MDEKTQKEIDSFNKNMDNFNNGLANLRIYIGYLLFDLEATRRERDLLKNILENQSPKDETEE